MNSQIQNAAAAGQRVVVKPRLVRAIGVMKPRVDREHLSQRAALDQRLHLLHRGNVSIREIDPERAVSSSRDFNNASGLESVASERLLTEDRQTAIECGD